MQVFILSTFSTGEISDQFDIHWGLRWEGEGFGEIKDFGLEGKDIYRTQFVILGSL